MKMDLRLEHFSYGWFRKEIRLETEEKGNSKMAYLHRLFSISAFSLQFQFRLNHITVIISIAKPDELLMIRGKCSDRVTMKKSRENCLTEIIFFLIASHHRLPFFFLRPRKEYTSTEDMRHLNCCSIIIYCEPLICRYKLLSYPFTPLPTLPPPLKKNERHQQGNIGSDIFLSSHELTLT